MRILANKDNKHVLFSLASVMAIFVLLSQGMELGMDQKISLPLLLLSLAALCCVLSVCIRYFYRQDKMLETAVFSIEAFLSGDTDARVDCDREGELYKLFHAVNTLAAVLNAHAANEMREKAFLKNTISDISHQLKTPLAALNIYNGLLQEEPEDPETVKKLTALSEQELDRIEMLVQNLLKITKLDANAIAFEKTSEPVADMMKDVKLHFAYRAEREEKKIVLSGDERILLLCDRDWLMEAIGNIVKNALDHTKSGDSIFIGWKRTASIVQIKIKDNGSGIHPEDLPHIFKRFYRSRFSGDIQGIGLGLPLAKAIIEAHDGAIEVDSELGKGTTFLIDFLIPTNL